MLVDIFPVIADAAADKDVDADLIAAQAIEDAHLVRVALEQLRHAERVGVRLRRPLPGLRVPVHRRVVVVLAAPAAATRMPLSGPAARLPSPSPSMRGCGAKSAGLMPSRRLNAARRFWMRSPHSSRSLSVDVPAGRGVDELGPRQRAGQHREHAEAEAVHRLVRVGVERLGVAFALGALPLHVPVLLVGGLGQREADAERLVPRRAEPAVWRPGVGSAMYVTPISEVKRLS